MAGPVEHALAGYEACHELSACMLSAAIGHGKPARGLVVGAGGGGMEMRCAARLEPHWTYLAIDSSQPMMDIARHRIEDAGLGGCIEFHTGYVQDSVHDQFDAATLIGVLHHLEGNEAKHSILTAIAERLKPGAPLILAGNRHAYESKPLLLAAWAERWRMFGAGPEEVRAKQAKILQGADPPDSEEAVANLLAKSGFGPPQMFFSSLFWGAWITKRF